MPQIIDSIKPINKPKAFTRKRAEIIRDVFIPLVMRTVLLEMDSGGIGPYNRKEIRDAFGALETLIRKRTEKKND